MHRHPLRLVLPVLGLLLATVSWSAPGQASAPSAKISIVPGPASVKVLIDASAPLAGVTAAYGPNPPSALVVDLGAVAPPAKPAVPAEAAAVIRDVRIEPGPAQKTTLVLALAEPLPYSLAVDKGQTVIEILRILRNAGDVIPPKGSDGGGGAATTLDDIVVSDRSEAVDITARTGRKAATNVFALDQPLRLVVDLFDTILARPTFVRSVGKAGVGQVRVGQYKDAPPVAITRLVFELSQAGQFRVNSGERELTVSFAASGGKAQPVPAGAKPAATTAPAGQQAAAPAQKTAAAAPQVAKPQPAAADAKPAPTTAPAGSEDGRGGSPDR